MIAHRSSTGLAAMAWWLLACTSPGDDEDTNASTNADTTAQGASASDDAPSSGTTEAGATGQDASAGTQDPSTGGTTGSAESDGGTTAPTEPPDAMTVYAMQCSPCHGDEGEGVVDGPTPGPEIRHADPVLAHYLVRAGDTNATVNAAGAPVGHPSMMTAFDAQTVSDEQLDEILAWLDGFPKPQTGAELFADYCGFCHGDGNGGDDDYATPYHNIPFTTSGASDTLPEFIARVRSGHVVDDRGVAVGPDERRSYMPAFDATILSDEELALMEQWARQH
ncbi:MAG: c-type cytochrome [Nannocystaceae bacterium]|nr:c-type cytochrome [Nannocystaceae bacterium]